MAVYYDQKIVKEFVIHRFDGTINIPVKIIDAIRGGSCCGESQHPKSESCYKCGKPLTHKEVTLIVVEGSTVMVLDRVTPLNASRRAEELIDEWFARPPAKTDGSDKKDPPKGIVKKPRSPKKPKRPRGQKNDSELIIPPIPPGLEFDKDDEREDLGISTELIEQMKKLGWGEKARQIVEDIENKDPNDD